MDKSLQTLCSTLKKIIWKLKPQQQPLSFLLLIGREGQGKSTLLRQSSLEHVTIDAALGLNIYYNDRGIIVEMSESWFAQSNHLLYDSLKSMNRCHRGLRITGVLICIDINELLPTEPSTALKRINGHLQLLHRFGSGLGYKTHAAIIFTKIDILAGFCDFFHNEHESDLQKPLGFSLEDSAAKQMLIDGYKLKFEQLIDALGQQIIHKIHPARSGIKRSLIREFPLQLASLRMLIQPLIQGLSSRYFHLQACYFTSAEQGANSIDRLHQKVQNDYALSLPDHFPQSINFRPYFVQGALEAMQEYTKQFIAPRVYEQQQWFLRGLIGTSLLVILSIAYQYIQTTNMLNITENELSNIDNLLPAGNKNPSALYHLTKASESLDNLSVNPFFLAKLQQLKNDLHQRTSQDVSVDFLPTLLADIEKTLHDPQLLPWDRYRALKVYLSLEKINTETIPDIQAWFSDYWKKEGEQRELYSQQLSVRQGANEGGKGVYTQYMTEAERIGNTAENSSAKSIQRKLTLLQRALRHTSHIMINKQSVTDTRNLLNALPASYLYYALAKQQFPQKTQHINFPGFHLATHEIPAYFTKDGYDAMQSRIARIAHTLQTENWVLARQDLANLPAQLLNAYANDYTLFWQNIIKYSHPIRSQSYQQIAQLSHTLRNETAIQSFLTLIQQETRPNLNHTNSAFNEQIASKFTELSLLGNSSMQQLNETLAELENFLTTIAIVNDQGKTAFTITLARFQEDRLSNPISALYRQARQLPTPISTWIQGIADDTWSLLINDTRQYINHRWQTLVFKEYQHNIANRYPFGSMEQEDILTQDFDRFFAAHGTLNQFIESYVKPFIDTTYAQWRLKEVDHYVLPIPSETVDELIRANIITNMFFPDQHDTSSIRFSLEKLSLDPIVGTLKLSIGEKMLVDDQTTESRMRFRWPQSSAKLELNSIEGNHYELLETGPWAFFKILQQVNVIVDEEDNANLQILFDINGNAGRYLLRTDNKVNPFTPGMLSGFHLPDKIA